MPGLGFVRPVGDLPTCATETAGFSLSLWERAGVRAAERTHSLFPGTVARCAVVLSGGASLTRPTVRAACR
ncbi:hypothetical protein DTA24_21300 [Klebsiella sp. P1CD1]|nr:hypothetical protein DTA24_21300 [Klebsiella sp. P1CD1]PXI04922.1 hypothetical protein DMQ94_08575 [Klebsiella variicola]PXK97672.1 hypothetical protein DMS44_03490 [Klebsiella variicola]PXL63654.1 hypothetical protein DMS45_01935 [Klebsiella variicola]HBX9989292.1 hypothetical protein [Klebsiella variicola]